MTDEELQKIKEHIYMRSRIEPYATEIIRILKKAVEELEATKELQEHHKKVCEELIDLMGLISKSELEKENAELKLKLEALEGQTPWKDIKDKSEVIEQLTKAKELLKEWMQTSKASSCDNINIVTDTEQFLNSEVENV